MRLMISLVLIFLLAVVAFTGCSDVAVPISGGTRGTMTSDGKAMSQMELTFYAESVSSELPVAYGMVQSDGSFELVNAARTGEISLEAGRYRVTVESIGAEVNIPPRYGDFDQAKLLIEHVPPAPIAIEVPGLSEGM